MGSNHVLSTIFYLSCQWKNDEYWVLSFFVLLVVFIFDISLILMMASCFFSHICLYFSLSLCGSYDTSIAKLDDVNILNPFENLVLCRLLVRFFRS